MNKQLVNRIINIALLCVLGYLVYFNFLKNTCGEVLTYKVGEVDQRFNLSRSEAIKYAKSAGELWNDALNQNVLVYDENGEIVIDFVYDERQRTTINNNILKEKAKNNIEFLETKSEEIDTSKISFEQAKKEYQVKVSTFNSDLQNYNNKVEVLNKNGGGTRDQVKMLDEEKVALEIRSRELENERINLNSKLSLINESVEGYNNLGKEVNKIVDKINERAVETFEEGIYYDGKIILYEFEDIPTLKRLIAHELGHALGLDHTKDENSIMYYINQGEEFKIKQEDIDEYNKVCKTKNKF